MAKNTFQFMVTISYLGNKHDTIISSVLILVPYNVAKLDDHGKNHHYYHPFDISDPGRI